MPPSVIGQPDPQVLTGGSRLAGSGCCSTRGFNTCAVRAGLRPDSRRALLGATAGPTATFQLPPILTVTALGLARVRWPSGRRNPGPIRSTRLSPVCRASALGQPPRRQAGSSSPEPTTSSASSDTVGTLRGAVSGPLTNVLLGGHPRSLRAAGFALGRVSGPDYQVTVVSTGLPAEGAPPCEERVSCTGESQSEVWTRRLRPRGPSVPGRRTTLDNRGFSSRGSDGLVPSWPSHLWLQLQLASAH